MNKNKFLLLFLLCCGLPLLAAKVVLAMGWYNGGASSNGQWQQSDVFLLDATKDQAHWRLAVTSNAQCNEHCLQALFTLKQLYIGLGRKQDQVQPVLISQQAVPDDYAMFVLSAPRQAVPAALEQRILLIDQQGLVLLSYPMPEAESEMALTAKAIRKDLLKLLNYDRTSA